MALDACAEAAEGTPRAGFPSVHSCNENTIMLDWGLALQLIFRDVSHCICGVRCFSVPARASQPIC